MIDHDEVRSLARLASLAVEPADLDRLAGELANVFALVDTLKDVDVEGIEPMAHPVATRLRLRADEVGDAPEREALMAAAPAVEAGHFLVPRVIE